MTALRLITRVTYRGGLLEGKTFSPDCLPTITLGAAEIPRDIVALIQRLGLLDLGGTYGDPRAGAPVQYDRLSIRHSLGKTDITVFNRAIALFTTDDEPIVHIHQVCCKLESLAHAGK